MNDNIPESNDAHPPTLLKEVAGDVTRIVQDYITSLTEKDETIFKLRQEKLQLEAEAEESEAEKKNLSDELNSAIDALELLEKGTKNLQEKFFSQLSMLSVVQTEIEQLAKACGFSLVDSSDSNKSLPENLNKSGNTCSPFQCTLKEREKELTPDLPASLLSSSFDAPSILLSLRQAIEFVQALRHDFTLMEIEVDRSALSAQLSSQFAFDSLLDAEQESRELLVEEGLHSIPLYFASQAQLRLMDLYNSLEKHTASFLHVKEEEKQLEQERYRTEVHRHARDSKKAKKQVEELENEVEMWKKKLEETNSATSFSSQQSFLWTAFLESSLVLFQQRSATAEKLWRQNIHQLLKRFSLAERRWKEKMEVLETEQRHSQETIKKQYSMLLQQEKLAASYSKNIEISTHKIEELNKEVSAQRTKCSQLQKDREEGRKKKDVVLQEQKAKNVSLELLISQQKAELLQKTEEGKNLRAANKELQNRITSLKGVIDELQPAAVKGRVLPELLQTAEQRFLGLIEQLTEQEERKSKELETVRAQMEILKEEKTSAMISAEQSLSALNEEKRQQQASLAMLQAEVKELQAAAHAMRVEKEESTRKLWIEQEARSIFEQQHHMEADVVKKLVEKVEKAERSASTAIKLQKERQELVRKVAVLEDACRKSAQMIAELRETVFSERQLSAQLLSSMSYSSLQPLKKSLNNRQ